MKKYSCYTGKKICHPHHSAVARPVTKLEKCTAVTSLEDGGGLVQTLEVLIFFYSLSKLNMRLMLGSE